MNETNLPATSTNATTALPADNVHRSFELLSRVDSRLAVIDMQEKLLPHIPVGEMVLANCAKLIAAAQILGVPVSATEQYPRGLGPTAAALRDKLPPPIEKIRFSAAEALAPQTAALAVDGREKLVLCGIEAHVCVLQTALDLMNAGYRIYLPADAVASRHKHDWKWALRRLADAGAILTTTEAILFEWCETAASPDFKQISNLVTGRN